MSHVFISYAHEDKLFADRLSEDLLDKGYPVWIDGVSLVGGMKWEEEIEKNIRDCACVLVVVSANAETSTWVEKEIGFANAYNRPLIPLLYSGSISNMPHDLAANQGIDFASNYADGLRKLAASPSLPPVSRRAFSLTEVLREGEKTFSSVANVWRSTVAFGTKDDSPVGLLLQRSQYGSKAYLVGRRNESMNVPESIQVFLQFSGSVEEPAFDQYLAFIKTRGTRLWTVLVRGPVESERFVLPDDKPAVWEDAVMLAWNAIDQCMFTASKAAFFMFAPNTLALGIGAARHFKYPIDIYNLNRNRTEVASLYQRVATIVPPR